MKGQLWGAIISLIPIFYFIYSKVISLLESAESLHKLQLQNYEIKINQLLKDFQSCSTNRDFVNFQQSQKIQKTYETSNKYYDAVITIDQFKDLTENQMYFAYKNNRIREILNGQVQTLYRVVGLLGLRNKGKTFILNQMIDEMFPSSNSISTKGISIKISKTSQNNTIQTIYLDTEGISKPAQIDWDQENDKQNDVESFKLIKGAFTQTSMIEKIQQEVVSSFSQVLIIIVGFLQHDDQKLIEQTLYLNINSRKDRKKIFIIHNLKEFTKIKEFEDYQNYIQNIFPLEKQIYENMTYYLDRRSEQINIEHHFFAQQFSEAGDILNKKTLSYLTKMIDSINQKFHFEEQIKKSVTDSIIKYFTIKQNNQIVQQVDQKNLLKVEQVNCTSNNTILQSVKTSIDLIGEESVCVHLMLNKEYVIEKVQYLIQDSIGIFHSQITYEIYSNNKGHLYVYVDSPGRQEIKNIIVYRKNFQKLIIELIRFRLNQNYPIENESNSDQQLEILNEVHSNFSFSESQYEIDLPQLKQTDNFYYKFANKEQKWKRTNQGQYLIELVITEM